MSATQTELLFVYGTLRIEIVEHVIPELFLFLHFKANGYVKGRLFEVDDYPGAVPAEGKNRVFGQILSFAEGFEKETLVLLDGYEDYSEQDIAGSLFRREKTIVYINETNTVNAWIYWYNKPVTNLAEIVGGVYSKS